MKKSIWAVFGLLISTLIWAANSDIKMVTYFPTRYMIYQDVTVKGPLEVGIGQPDEPVRLDVAQDVTMTHGRVADGTTLTLTGADVDIHVDINSEDAVGQSITSGSVSTDTRGTLVLNAGFEKEADGITDKVSFVGGVQSIETDHKATLTALTLGTKAFPACNDGNGGHNISWKKLTIGDKEGVFLVCGEGSDMAECEEGDFRQTVIPSEAYEHPSNTNVECTVKRLQEKCINGTWTETGTKVIGLGVGLTNHSYCTCYLGPGNCSESHGLDEANCKCACPDELLYHRPTLEGAGCTAVNSMGGTPEGNGVAYDTGFDTDRCVVTGKCVVDNFVWWRYQTINGSENVFAPTQEHCDYHNGDRRSGGGVYYQECKPNGTEYWGRFCIGSGLCSF